MSMMKRHYELEQMKLQQVAMITQRIWDIYLKKDQALDDDEQEPREPDYEEHPYANGLPDELTDEQIRELKG
jgi:hypothetical protein